MDHECSPAGLGGNNIGKHGQSKKDHRLQMVAVDVVAVMMMPLVMPLVRMMVIMMMMLIMK